MHHSFCPKNGINFVQLTWRWRRRYSTNWRWTIAIRHVSKCLLNFRIISYFLQFDNVYKHDVLKHSKAAETELRWARKWNCDYLLLTNYNQNWCKIAKWGHFVDKIVSFDNFDEKKTQNLRQKCNLQLRKKEKFFSLWITAYFR